MRRRPLQHGTPPLGGYDATPVEPQKATAIGSAQEPFLVGGGQTYWWVVPDDITPFDPRPQGIQLVTGVYVPKGKAGFVKRVTIAPTVPSVIGDAFRNGLQWWESENWPLGLYPGAGNRANSANGLWETPMAWEGFFPAPAVLPDPPLAVTPQWHWQVTLLQGDFRVVRENADTPAFNPFVPSSWYLLPSIPVPRPDNFAVPGNGLEGDVGLQRFPIMPRDDFSPHWLVPEDHSILLWATWNQEALTINSGSANGPNELATEVYPLGPSVGQLSGYFQAVQSEAARDNAEVGWGG
jgi:hypothetical protein